MALDINMFDQSRLSAVDQCVDDLEALGVITAKDAQAARSAAARASNAVMLSNQYTRHAETVAEHVGQSLAAVDDLSIDTVLAETTLADPNIIDATLRSVWNKSTKDARAAAFHNMSKVPAALTERFDAVSDEVLEIAAKLGTISTPQQAIDAGLVDEWQKLMELKGEFWGLVNVRSTLRSFYLIPGPTEYAAGWFWNQRIESPLGAFKAANEKQASDEGRALLVTVARCRPYCPATEAEAKATLEAANRGEQAAL